MIFFTFFFFCSTVLILKAILYTLMGLKETCFSHSCSKSTISAHFFVVLWEAIKGWGDFYIFSQWTALTRTCEPQLLQRVISLSFFYLKGKLSTLVQNDFEYTVSKQA